MNIIIYDRYNMSLTPFYIFLYINQQWFWYAQLCSLRGKGRKERYRSYTEEYTPVCRRLFKISGGIPTNQFAMPAKPPAAMVASRLSFPPSGVNCSFRYSYVRKYIPLAGISESIQGDGKLVIAQAVLPRPKMTHKHYVQLIIASRTRRMADRRHPVW